MPVKTDFPTFSFAMSTDNIFSCEKQHNLKLECKYRSHIDHVARLVSFRALKLSRLENFKALKTLDHNGGFLILKLSRLESFRALKLSRYEGFLTLKSKTLKEYFRALNSLGWRILGP